MILVQRRSVVMPLLVATALRLALWSAVLSCTGTRVLAGGDTPGYLEPGRNLLLHGRFWTAGLPEIGRVPGYPLFLALASLAGLAGAALVQAGISAANVWLVARLARAVGLSERAVLAAAWLMALEPVGVVYAVRLLSETLFTTLLLVSVERMAVAVRGQRWRALVCSGLALTAAIFVRPAAYYLPWIWALGLLFWYRRPAATPRSHFLSGQQRAVWAAVLLLATTVPFVALWQIRNAVTTGFSGFSSIAVRNAYFYAAAEAEAQATGRSFTEQQRLFGYPDEATYLRSHPEQANWSQAARLAYMQAESRRILWKHRAGVVRAQLVGAAVVTFSPCAAELLEMLGWDAAEAPVRVVHQGPLQAAWRILRTDPARAVLMALLELALLLLYLLAGWGGAGMRKGDPARGLLVVTGVYFILIAGGVQAVARYRAPVMPLVCVLAGAGLARIGQRAGSETA